MTTIHDAYINALLADAAYVKNLDATITPGDLTTALSDRMTPELAKYISHNFKIVTAYDAPDKGFGAGFDAVVWQGVNEPYTGKTYVSIRGTQEVQDFLDDGALAINGLPYTQLVDMVNWWLRETASEGDDIRQIAIETTLGLAGDGPTVKFVSAPTVKATETGALAGVNSIVSVNAHSLGGYMATAFSRLFGKKWSIEGVNTFNSAGFSSLQTQNIEIAFNQIKQAIGAGLSFDDFDVTAQQPQNNYFAEGGINVTTNDWNPVGFNQYGTRIGLFQEDGVKLTELGMSNHFMYKLTDMLALGDALAKLDPTLDFGRLNALVEAGANKTDASLEGILDGLRKTLIDGPLTDTPVGDVSESASSRTTYHENLHALQNNTYFQMLQDRVQVIAAPANGLAAKDDFGALLSLAYLTPFALKPNDSVATTILQSAQTAIGAKWVEDKTLSTEDRDNGKANFSDAWLTDRASMLSWLVKRNVGEGAAAINDNNWRMAA